MATAPPNPQNAMPFDWRIGAQYIAEKYMPDWWQGNASGITDQRVLADVLGKQLYSVLPNLTPQQYQSWLQDYTWLRSNGGKMPTGFTPPKNPDQYVPPPAWGSTPGYPGMGWAPGQPGQMWGGGSQNFDESTGRYRTPMQGQPSPFPRNPNPPPFMPGVQPTPPPMTGAPPQSPWLPWDKTGQYPVPFPTHDSNPNVWAGLSDAQVQRALAFYSAAMPYAELAESTRRFGQEMDWKRRVDSWGTTGRAQLPQGNTVRRW